MSAPRTELSRFLEAAFPGAAITQIAGDASTRSFFRLRLVGGASCVVMDYGASFDGETDDVRLSRVFREASLPVARILRAVPEVGCLVLEDLGERTMESTLDEVRLRNPLDECLRRFEDLYRQAVELAVALVVRGTPVLASSDRASGPVLDAQRFRFEMDFFVEHYVRGLRGIEIPPPPLVDDLYRLADRAAGGPRTVFCHRDFHSRNLMVRPDGSLAMVDIQDARWGPDTYDLASLLRDAYVDIPEPLVVELVSQYRAALPGRLSAAGFLARFDVVAAQRMIKALGTFAYQARVRNQPRYLTAVPRTLDRLERLLPRRSETTSLARRLEQAGLFSPESTSLSPSA